MFDHLRLVLGSQSPRRKQILTDAGISFTSRIGGIDECFPEGLNPMEVPAYIARNKALAVEDLCLADEVILTADTIVILNGKILGKPTSDEEAFKFLSALSGKMHLVITGVCIRGLGKEILFSDQTEVFFLELLHDQIKYYIEKFHPLDKAGAYGIQEWIGLIGIEKINGNYFNVMGLPIHLVIKALESF